MTSRGALCVLTCVFILCWCASSLERNVELGQRFRFQELSVTGKDLEACETQKNVCVMELSDCFYTSVKTKGPRTREDFLNTSCHYLIHKKSFTCRWIQPNVDETELIHSFIFSQDNDIYYCPGVINLSSSLYLTIKSRNVLSSKEMFSDVYPVMIKDIAQAPQPVITSVKTTATSLNVSWASGEDIAKCQINYRPLNTETRTKTEDFTPLEEEAEYLHVIHGLQPFTEYSLTISCSHGFGLWSDWSPEARVWTSETVPIAAPFVSYYVALDQISRTGRLWLLWRALNITEARGLIQGYEVSYMPIKRPSKRQTVHTSDLKVMLEVMAEEYDITVSAYNSAGHSPHRRLRVHAEITQDAPVVKGLWVYSEGPSLRLRWQHDFTAVNVSEFAVEWSPAENHTSSRWERVNGNTFTTVLSGIKPGETYSISVYPLYNTLSGPPASVCASLEHGTLLNLVHFRLVNVTKSSVTVEWAWQQAEPSIHVLEYRLVLRGRDETQSVPVFPNKQQHTFYNLQANAEYSVYVHGETRTGNVSKASLDISTPLLDYDKMMKFSVPLILLVLGFGIISFLTRTVFKEYFCPIIANPEYSLIGRWLLNPPYEGSEKICVLRLENFFTLDQQTEKNLQLERRESVITEADPVTPSKTSTASESIIQTVRTSSSDYVQNIPIPSAPPMYIDLLTSLNNFDYVQNGQIPGTAFLSEETSN